MNVNKYQWKKQWTYEVGVKGGGQKRAVDMKHDLRLTESVMKRTFIWGDSPLSISTS